MAIVKLEDFEHIRLRPGMYVGTTETPINLLFELIDNSADECLIGASNYLCIILDYDSHKYTVLDKGRGIPLKAKNFKEDAPVIIATKLFSGGKFDNELYKYRSGLHGVGLVAVNALSSEMEIITIKDNNTHRRYIFHGQNVAVEDMPSQQFSTLVSFMPDPAYFDSIDIDKDIIIDRLKSIMLCCNNDKLKIQLVIRKNNKTDVIDIQNTLLDEFKSNCTEFIEISNTHNGEEFTLYLGYKDDDRSKDIISIVNTLPIYDGTHIKMLQKIIKDYMYDKAQKNKYHIRKEDVLVRMHALCILKISNPSFSGQSKYALNNKQDSLKNLISETKITKTLDKYPDFVTNWLKSVEEYRIDLDKTRKVKKNGKGSTVVVEGLRDCTSPNIEERELFILEGESAGGTLLQCRDATKHAVLPLTGKILNVNKASKNKFFNNKVIMRLFQAMGVTPFTDDISQLRYDKIILLSDADPDGEHITVLLLSLFDYAAPSIIKNGKLYVAVTPLFGCYINKKFVPIFDEETLKKYKDKGIHIYRYKGLGEMQPDELKACALDPSTRKLIQILSSQGKLTIDKILKDKKALVKTYFNVGG